MTVPPVVLWFLGPPLEVVEARVAGKPWHPFKVDDKWVKSIELLEPYLKKIFGSLEVRTLALCSQCGTVRFLTSRKSAVEQLVLADMSQTVLGKKRMYS